MGASTHEGSYAAPLAADGCFHYRTWAEAPVGSGSKRIKTELISEILCDCSDSNASIFIPPIRLIEAIPQAVSSFPNLEVVWGFVPTTNPIGVRVENVSAL